MHSMQFRVSPGTADTHEQTAQQTRQVLDSTATEFGLSQKDGPFYVKGAFCLYVESPNAQATPVRTLWLGARFVDDSVVIDGRMWNPGCGRGRGRLFERVESDLGTRLTNAFGIRVIEIKKYQDQIPTQVVEKKS
jgi:hypothetical protein